MDSTVPAESLHIRLSKIRDSKDQINTYISRFGCIEQEIIGAGNPHIT